MAANVASWSGFYRFDSFPELLDSFVRIDFLINIFPGMTHQSVLADPVNSGIREEPVERMAAVVRRMFPSDTASL